MSSFSQNFVKPLAINSRQDDEQTRIDFVTAYSQSLDVTLQQALEAEREAEWWSDIEKSSWNVFWYLLQSEFTITFSSGI